MAAERARMEANGRVLIPAELRARLGLPGGGELLIEPQEDEALLLMTRARAVARV
jgi:AbrB family looped-hinge helix DNA binding protein